MKKNWANAMITTALLCVNGFIFLYRNHGFDFIKPFSTTSNTACNAYCIKKWTSPNNYFTPTSLDSGHYLLQENLQIDTIMHSENKLLAIGAWLNSELSGMHGHKNDSVDALPALQQFYCFKKNKTLNYDCGNFLTMYSFFCTAAGLPARHLQLIQITPGLSPDSHVAIEVYLKEYKKWVLTDAFQNHLLIKKNNVPLSATEYLDNNLQPGNDRLIISKQIAGKLFSDTSTAMNDLQDTYFNKNYIIYFYKETNPKIVYAWPNKIYRYLWPASWYEIYAPQQKNTNFLFRIKQLFMLALAGWLTFICFKNKKT